MKKLSILVALLALCLGLTACGGKTAAPTPSAAPSPTVTPDQAEPSAAPEAEQNSEGMEAPLPQLPAPMADVLNSLVDYGQGTAGSSLKNLSRAAGLLDWFGESQTADPLYDYSRDIRSWYDGLTEEQKQTFGENWAAVRENTRQLVEDPDSLNGMQEDAGVTNDYTALQGSYSGLMDVLDSLFDGELTLPQ